MILIYCKDSQKLAIIITMIMFQIVVTVVNTHSESCFVVDGQNG